MHRLSLAAALAAFAAALCCVGPLVFGALGLSTLTSLTLLRAVVPYRNAFMALTALALAAGYVGVRRRRRVDPVGAARDARLLLLAALFAAAVLGYSLWRENVGLWFR